MIWSEIEFQGRTYKYSMQTKGSMQWLHVMGETLAVDLNASSSSKKSRRKSDGSSTAVGVDAPMPGKVTKVLVAKNQEVKKGTAVIVMEAMKMEYTLKAEIDTTISEILVQVGQQVALGQNLVSFLIPTENKDTTNG